MNSANLVTQTVQLTVVKQGPCRVGPNARSFAYQKFLFGNICYANKVVWLFLAELMAAAGLHRKVLSGEITQQVTFRWPATCLLLQPRMRESAIVRDIMMASWPQCHWIFPAGTSGHEVYLLALPPHSAACKVCSSDSETKDPRKKRARKKTPFLHICWKLDKNKGTRGSRDEWRVRKGDSVSN